MGTEDSIISVFSTELTYSATLPAIYILVT